MGMEGINSVSSSVNTYVNATNAHNNQQKATNSTTNSTANNTETKDQDTFIKSDEKDSKVTKPDQAKLQEIIAQTQKQTEAFKSMVIKLLSKQGMTFEEIMSEIEQGNPVNINIDQETIDEAKEAVSEDGYYGVKKTSERILGFATAFAGGDEAKLEQMKKAFEDGFKEAMQVWGAEDIKDMPQISQDTYAAVMKGFDDLMGEQQ